MSLAIMDCLDVMLSVTGQDQQHSTAVEMRGNIKNLTQLLKGKKKSK